jgi:hypothetical protein
LVKKKIQNFFYAEQLIVFIFFLLVAEEYGEFVHPCENDMVFKTKMCDKIPKFNAPIFLENKVMIGTVDEVFGPINDVVQ